MSLPLPSPNQAYWDVSALLTGEIDMHANLFIANAPKDEIIHAPVLSFLLRSSSHPGTNLLFDLGIRRDPENYPPGIVERIKKHFPIDPSSQDAIQALEKGGLTADDITHICISHCHWDHIGDPSLFPQATIIVGGESRSLFNPGYPEDPTATFASDLLPPSRTIFLPTPSEASGGVWKPLGPFPHAYDYYDDGSLYIVHAGAGHLPGHINILARTSASNSWVYLGGDSAHVLSLLTGEHEFAAGSHRDMDAVKEHVGRMRALLEENKGENKVRVLLAHDRGWYEGEGGEGEEAFWPGKIKSS